MENNQLINRSPPQGGKYSKWCWFIIIISPVAVIAAIWATEFTLLLMPCWFVAVFTAAAIHGILAVLRVNSDKRWSISGWSLLISFILYSAVYLYSLHKNMGIVEVIKYQIDRMWLYAEGI